MKRIFCIVGIAALSIFGTATISSAEKLTKTDKAFIASYKQAVGQVQPANLRETLLRTTMKPQVLIKNAKGFCSRLQSGMTLEEVYDLQSEVLNDPQMSKHTTALLVTGMSIIDRLAVPYYCPNVVIRRTSR